MPSRSPEQARMMAAIAHGWKPKHPRHKMPPLAVAREFNQADRGTKMLNQGMRRPVRKANGGFAGSAGALGVLGRGPTSPGVALPGSAPVVSPGGPVPSGPMPLPGRTGALRAALAGGARRPMTPLRSAIKASDHQFGQLHPKLEAIQARMKPGLNRVQDRFHQALGNRAGILPVQGPTMARGGRVRNAK